MNEINKPSVIFIGNSTYEWVRIKSTNDLINESERIIKTVPFDLELMGILNTNKPKKTQKSLHFRFKKSNIKSDWFRLTDDIKQFIKGLNK